MEFKVEPMRLEDLEEVVEIEKDSFATPWSRNSFLYELLENERAIYLVAKTVLGKVIGYVGMWVVLDEGHITNLATHHLYRRQGVGKALLNQLFVAARQSGVKNLTLEVRRSNIDAQSLYQKLGFVHMGIRRKYYLDNKEDALIMWKGPI